jgi:WD40 repeat protein
MAAVLVLALAWFAGFVNSTRDALSPQSKAEYSVNVGPGSLRDLVVSPRGGEFAVATEGGAVQIRSVADGAVRLRLRLKVPTYAEIHLAYSGNGALIAAGGGDGVAVWDVTTGQERAHIPRPDAEVIAVALSPDGTRAVYLDGKHVWVSDLAKPNTRRQLRSGKFLAPANLVFGPDGTWVAEWMVPYSASPLTLFSPDNGDEVRGIGSSVSRASFGRDGRTVLVHQRGDRDELIRYDTTTGSPIGDPIAHDPAGIPPIALRPDGAQIAAADGVGIEIWNAADGRRLGEPLTLGDPPLPLRATALVYSADGKALLVGYFDRVDVFAAP